MHSHWLMWIYSSDYFFSSLISFWISELPFRRNFFWCYLVDNFSGFYLPKNVIMTFPFTAHRILHWQLFSFCTWNMTLHFLMIPLFLYKNELLGLFTHFYGQCVCSSLEVFKFSICLWFLLFLLQYVYMWIFLYLFWLGFVDFFTFYWIIIDI